MADLSLMKKHSRCQKTLTATDGKASQLHRETTFYRDPCDIISVNHRPMGNLLVWLPMPVVFKP